ncbi:MAG: polysaccharide pyruvyl transferase family protein [Clostridia bacterium]|nr:polysaccharide pyruvyl transferase family protein [Clostridia bacterium]
MRIGILTFHRSYNYGAYMQSYALSTRVMRDFPGADVEIIDYAPARMYKNYDTSVKTYIFGPEHAPSSPITACKKAVKLILNPTQLKKTRTLHKAFERDLKYLPLSDYRVVSDDYIEAFDAIRGKYDVVVVGSDCVWEFITYGFPNPYFLNDNLGAFKMSYAASSDRMHISAVTEEQQKYIKEALSDFEYLGIRDVATENFSKHIVPDKTTSHNCDPTVILDINDFADEKEIVKNKLLTAGIDLSKPIIGLMCSDEIADAAISHFGAEYQYVSLYWQNKNSNVSLCDLTPREWAVAFSFFKLTITRFFHGTLLSMKNGVPALTIDEWPMTDEEHISKLEDLYNRLDLKEHYCRRSDYLDGEKQKQILNTAKSFIDNSVDKEKIVTAMNKEADSYLNFKNELEKVISKLEKGENEND